jgi:hypothetical protein
MAANDPGFISLPRNTGGPSVQTFEGFPEGMNVALPPHELDDTSARYLQDILLDQPGYIRRRGPIVNSVEAFPNTAFKATGIAFTLDPQGNNRLGILNGDTSHGQFSLLNAAFTAVNANVTWNGFLPAAPPNDPYSLVDVKAGLTNGVWIGTSSQYDSNSPTQTLAHWRGGINADYTTGSITVARGSASITGSGTLWLANASPGMFVFANTDDPYTLAYVGIVLKVIDDTHILLGANSPYAATAKTYKLTSIRGFEPRIVTGRITTTTASAVVTGANTKFTTELVTGGVYQVYRAKDFGFIGKLLSVTNDTSLTLVANAALALNNESYIILRVDGNYSIDSMSGSSKVGFLNATYAERQWFANLGQSYTTTNRVWFSEPTDPEDIDMSTFDGNYIDVASTTGVNAPVTGLCPAYNALLVFKENETFGIFGNTTSTFNVQKIEDDGALSAGSIQNFGGGVLWAGRTGIFFYDGVQTTNIVAGSLGNWYKDLVRGINPKKNRMWSAMSRDHYFLFLEQASSSVPVIKGITSSTPSYTTIVINMVSKAPTVFTNFALRGGIQMPASTGLETLLLFNTSTVGKMVSSTHVFNDTGNDAFVCDVASAVGPDFYIESKKYNADDSLILKLWNQILVNYECSGDALNVDTVVGLNDIGLTSSTQLTPTIFTWDTLKATFSTWNTLKAQKPTWASLITAVFKPKRLRFLKRSQNFAFRIWQNSPAVDHVVIGPFQLGYKKMRPGRI